MTGGRVKLDARISPPAYRMPPPPAVTECAGDACRCRRDPLAHPPRLLLFDQEAGAYREVYRACTAVWAQQSGGHPSGRVCGAPATHQVADVLLCEHHYRRMREWMNTRDQRDVIEATRKARQIADAEVCAARKRDQELREIARERAEEQRRLDAETARLQAQHAKHQFRLQLELDRQRIEAEEAVRAERTVVYYVQRQSDGLIKIGTSRGLAPRMVTLKREHGPLLLIAVVAGSHKEETALHRQFKELRAKGEWFRPELPLLEHVYALMKERPLEPDPSLPPLMVRRAIGSMIWRIKMAPVIELRRQRVAYAEEQNRKRREHRQAKAAESAAADPAA